MITGPLSKDCPSMSLREGAAVAEVVAVFAATHTPLFLLRRNEPSQEVQDEVFSCYEGMGKAMLDRGAEALVVFENDHLHSLFRYR